jgi:chromosome segregation ATPase
MTPDQESRVRALERDMAGVQQRLDDLKQDVASLTPLVVGHAELRAAIAHIETEIARLGMDLFALKTEIAKLEGVRQEERQEQLRDSRNWRRALVLGSFTVLAAVIGAAATIIASSP